MSKLDLTCRPSAITAQPWARGERGTSLLFHFHVSERPGKGTEAWLDLGRLGWARLEFVIVNGETAIYEVAELRSASEPAPPGELMWLGFSAPQQRRA